MLGKKLYIMISELNTSERKFLFNKSKKSEDKRFKQLAFLLATKRQSIEHFQKNLEKVQPHIAPKGASENVISAATRRFIDFCMKEIEQLKIELFLKENHKVRNYVLAEIYKEEEDKELFEDYLDKLNSELSSTADYWMRDYCLVQMSNLKLRTQTTRDNEDWKKLMVEQKKLVQEFYLKKTSTIIDKIASLYLDSKENVSGMEDIFPDEGQILSLIDQTKDPLIISTLYGSLAQLNFEQETRFKLFSGLAMDALAESEGNVADFIRKKILFVEFLHAFHTGKKPEIIIPYITQVVEINKKYKIEDQRDLFFLFLCQIIFQDKTGKINYYKADVRKTLHLKSAEYFHKFLEALQCFLNEEMKEAKSILMNVSYSKNPYVATWSRLLEIIINIRQGNNDLAESYIVSEIRKIMQNKERVFTFNSTIILVLQAADLLAVRIPVSIKKLIKVNGDLSPLHKLLADYLVKP